MGAVEGEGSLSPSIRVFSLSVCLSVCLSLSVSLSLSLFLSLSLSPSSRRSMRIRWLTHIRSLLLKQQVLGFVCVLLKH